ncbi:efflux RND transporter periplasmic adaptor subunit [Xanthobacter sp. NM-25]|uniref:efflux RND transporter periplasmic adaptor subunit n=1 Tax=Xanthobacter sp. NM-25 TaxID=2744465 RepID=UPI001EDDA2DE|nr:efflux RND transporter periplasmic adaptor subunit [Xanthobacter sp. NM-25]
MTSEGRRRGRVVLAVVTLAVAGGGAWLWQDKPWLAKAPTESAAGRPREVAVLVGAATRKPMPVRVEALGTVEAMVTVPVRSRVAAEVEKVAFADGATVAAGDLLFELDSRVIDAQIRQAEATLAKDRVQLEKARRDVERYSGLVTRAAISQVQLDDAKTTADVQQATVDQDEANLQSLKVQRGYYEIRSPVTGRIGVAAARAGTVIRVDDTLATVRQLKPIYVAFGLPERYINDLRTAQNAQVAITLQGSGETIGGGRVAVIDNTVDPQTGTLTARAVFANADERLWPGTLGAVTVTLRTEPDVVVVPSEAVQSGQSGPFVFVVEDGAARVRPVVVARTVDGESVIAKGLEGTETVVIDGQLSLREGSRVRVKRPATPVAGS